MLPKYKKEDILRYVKNIALVLIGTMVLAFGTAIFIVPFELVTGGVSGLAIVFSHVIPLDISIDVYIAVLTWSLFILGAVFLGKDFALKTLLSSLFYPPLFSLFLYLTSPDALGGFFSLASSGNADAALLVSAIFGAICVGAGCALTFLGGGSTGGMDILAFLICKPFKHLRSSVVIFVIDAVIVVLGVFAVGNLLISLLGISSAIICALVVDYVFLGGTRALVAEIITEKYEEVSREVISTLSRTTTVIDCVGGFSGERKKMVMVSFRMREYGELMNIINKIDKRAFMTISRAHEINGEGWTFGDVI